MNRSTQADKIDKKNAFIRIILELFSAWKRLEKR